jgi:A/G-specific adenine glycosylase
VLVSEVMLQQTQAARVAEIYPRFVARFPTVDAMAAVDAATVIRAWENLGYNRRALNMWRAALAISERGAFPRTSAELETLPGIGPYTARAVASFAFGERVAAVDANVKRVLLRLYGDAIDVQATGDALVGRDAPVWNQAMIDFGAVVCTARNPRCDACPLSGVCSWRRSRPAARPKATSIRFEDTSRFARGRVVEALREHGAMTRAQLAQRVALSNGRIDDALGSLQADELVHRTGRTIALGPAASSRR